MKTKNKKRTDDFETYRQGLNECSDMIFLVCNYYNYYNMFLFNLLSRGHDMCRGLQELMLLQIKVKGDLKITVTRDLTEITIIKNSMVYFN